MTETEAFVAHQDRAPQDAADAVRHVDHCMWCQAYIHESLARERAVRLPAADTATPPDPEPIGWYCACGHPNGINLAVCACCGRAPGGDDNPVTTIYRTTTPQPEKATPSEDFIRAFLAAYYGFPSPTVMAAYVDWAADIADDVKLIQSWATLRDGESPNHERIRTRVAADTATRPDQPDQPDLVTMARCEHNNRSGGNDYIECHDCGLMWDYRRPVDQWLATANKELVKLLAATRPDPHPKDGEKETSR